MNDRDPDLINSGLSRVVKADGVTVQVEIYRLDDRPGWTLEVVNEKGTSTVWDDLFDSDDAAYAEFRETVETDGMKAFLDSAVVIPFRQ